MLEMKEKMAKKCFLSFRFTDRSMEYAETVKRFLSLSEIEVITGMEFEPQSVSKKISERLAAVDFGVAIISNEDQSMWTRDEVVSLNEAGKSVIFLVEQGADFSEGIFGDIEVIWFPENSISETFIKILEGIKYIETSG